MQWLKEITEELVTGVQAVRAGLPTEKLDAWSNDVLSKFDQVWADLPVPVWDDEQSLRHFFVRMASARDLSMILSNKAEGIEDEEDPRYRAAALYACFDIFKMRCGKALRPTDPTADMTGAWPFETERIGFLEQTLQGAIADPEAMQHAAGLIAAGKSPEFYEGVVLACKMAMEIIKLDPSGIRPFLILGTLAEYWEKTLEEDKV